MVSAQKEDTYCFGACQVPQMHMFRMPRCKRPCCFIGGHQCRHCCGECLRRLEGRDIDATELAESLQSPMYTWPCLTCGRPDTSYYVDRDPIYCYRCGAYCCCIVCARMHQRGLYEVLPCPGVPPWLHQMAIEDEERRTRDERTEEEEN